MAQIEPYINASIVSLSKSEKAILMAMITYPTLFENLKDEYSTKSYEEIALENDKARIRKLTRATLIKSRFAKPFVIGSLNKDTAVNR